MNELTNYVAGLPVWVWPIVWFVGAVVHVPCVLAASDGHSQNSEQAWVIFWPIVTPICILAYPLRRLVRWWRRDAQTGESKLGSAEPRPVADSTPHQRIPAGVAASPGWPLQYTAALGNRWPLKFSPIQAAALTEPDRSKATRIPTGGVPEKPVSRSEFEELTYKVDTSFADAAYVDDLVVEVRSRLAALEAKGAKVRAWRGHDVIGSERRLLTPSGCYGSLRGGPWTPWANNVAAWEESDGLTELPQHEAERLAAECREELGL